MVRLKKDSDPIAEAYFWEWLMESEDFKATDYIEDVVARNSISTAIRILRAFKTDLVREGLLHEL